MPGIESDLVEFVFHFVLSLVASNYGWIIHSTSCCAFFSPFRQLHAIVHHGKCLSTKSKRKNECKKIRIMNSLSECECQEAILRQTVFRRRWSCRPECGIQVRVLVCSSRHYNNSDINIKYIHFRYNLIKCTRATQTVSGIPHFYACIHHSIRRQQPSISLSLHFMCRTKIFSFETFAPSPFACRGRPYVYVYILCICSRELKTIKSHRLKLQSQLNENRKSATPSDSKRREHFLSAWLHSSSIAQSSKKAKWNHFSGGDGDADAERNRRHVSIARSFHSVVTQHAGRNNTFSVVVVVANIKIYFSSVCLSLRSHNFLFGFYLAGGWCSEKLTALTECAQWQWQLYCMRRHTHSTFDEFNGI